MPFPAFSLSACPALLSSVGQLSGCFSMGMRRGRWEWAGQRGCAWMLIARMGQSLGECGLDSGHTQPCQCSCPLSPVAQGSSTSNLPPFRVGLVGARVYVYGREWRDRWHRSWKGAQRPCRPCQGGCFCFERHLVAKVCSLWHQTMLGSNPSSSIYQMGRLV